MILNLPHKFPLERLSLINFGSADAVEDNLLLECPTPLPLFSEISNGSKDIIHGYRGTGKSSIVRLISQRQLQFKSEPDVSCSILVINSPTQYLAVREFINKNKEKGTKSKIVIRLIWETLIIYRALQHVNEALRGSDDNLRAILDEYDNFFGRPKEKGLFEIFLSLKKRVGIQFDANIPTKADLYASVETDDDEPTADEPIAAGANILKISEHKTFLSKLLLDNKLRLHILMDSLDDFVSQEQYSIQKDLLQELLSCQRDYRHLEFQTIKVLIFLRTDLFLRLDKNNIGPDKIEDRSLEIYWTPADLKQFISRRLAANFPRIFNQEHFEVAFHERRLWLTKEQTAELNADKSLSLGQVDIFQASSYRMIWGKVLGRLYMWMNKKKNTSRIRSFGEVFNEIVISTVFPETTKHHDLYGETKDINFQKFLETHFQLGFDQATPRIILLYMKECLNQARHYYESNPDIEILADEDGRYNLFHKDLLLSAYEVFRKSMWRIQTELSSEYQAHMKLLRKFRTAESFSFDDFNREQIDEKEKLSEFFGFCSSSGMIKCTNSNVRPELRNYKFPLIFQLPISQHPTDDSMI